jgi:3-oxoacyl-[acyl-carrier protein] reductase
MELTGKTALVTGGSRGIGRAICLALANAGAAVAVNYHLPPEPEFGRDNAADAQEVVGAIETNGGRAVAVAGSVADKTDVERIMREVVDAFGALDILVNNVGGSGGVGSFDQATAAQWTEVLDRNLMAAVWCSQRAVELMRERGGCIVHINSIYGREYGTSAPYTAAKSALTALTKEMALDLARYRIRVNGVAPGSILFPGGSWDRRQKAQPEKVEKMVREELPWGRFGTPEEVADVVTFLCSERARWVTGATLPVDGGQGRAF